MNSNEPQPDDRRAWRAGWALVFLLNVPLPLAFGHAFTEKGGRVGMYAALAAVWWLGHRYLSRATAVRGAVLAGAVLVALTQVVTLARVQMGAGFVALFLVGATDDRPLSQAQGFFATVFTGAALLLASLVLGYVFHGFRPAQRA